MPLDYRLIADPTAPIGHLRLSDQKRVCEMRTAYQLALAKVSGDAVTDPDTVARIVAPYLRGATLEHLYMLGMDASRRLVSEPMMLARGTQDSCDVDPRVVLRAALTWPTCASIILAHNHPTGNPNPSPADRSCTKRISDACRMVGLQLSDHVIVISETSFTSMRCESPQCFCS